LRCARVERKAPGDLFPHGPLTYRWLPAEIICGAWVESGARSTEHKIHTAIPLLLVSAWLV